MMNPALLLTTLIFMSSCFCGGLEAREQPLAKKTKKTMVKKETTSQKETTNDVRSEKKKRPNILFIFSDDHSHNAIGAYDGWLKSVNPTPNIDSLAREGMLFRNSFCTNSICGPSRAVILTGKHSHKNGFMQNGNRFDGSQQTFPKLLRKSGYQTAMIGKWHLGTNPQGFDYWDVLPGQGRYYNPILKSEKGQRTVIGHCTDVVTDLAIEWLKNNKDSDKPFMLMCQHKAPHRCWMPALRHLELYDGVEMPEPKTLFDKHEDNASPARWQEMEIDRHMDEVYDLFFSETKDWEPENPWATDRSGYRNKKSMTQEQLTRWNAFFDPRNEKMRAANLSGQALVRAKYQRYIKNYLRCIKGVDESVGRLREFLKTSGLDENTIVIYSSDQGFYLGDHGWYDKRWMYEESMRMPLIAHWPGVTQPGSVNENLVQNLDYAETFLEVAGAPIPNDMQGQSLVPLLKGESPEQWRDSLYYHYFAYPSVHMVPKQCGVRGQRYKLISFYQFDEWEFYDLEKDPNELNNLYGKSEYANEITTMKSKLEELRTKFGDTNDVSAKPEAWRKKMRANQLKPGQRPTMKKAG